MKPIVVYKDLPWYYAELLVWRFEGGEVKAFPKKPLSDTAHKWVLRAFRKWGGKFVRWNGRCWYEAPVKPRSSLSTKTAVDILRAYEELQKECPRRNDCVAPWKSKRCKPEYFPSGSLKCLIVKTEELQKEVQE